MTHQLRKKSEDRKEETLALLAPYIKEVTFFKERKLALSTIVNLLQRMQLCILGPKEEIMRIGELGDKFYIILKGTIEV